MDITQLLLFTVKNNASDLHISTGVPPFMRVHGRLQALDMHPLSKSTTQRLLYETMNQQQRHCFEEYQEIDFIFVCHSAVRFRVNIFLQQRGIAGAFRMILSTSPK